MNMIAIAITILMLATDVPDDLARYADVYTHSMFSRNRRADAPPLSDTPPPERVEVIPPGPVDPASHYLLVGVSLIGDQRIAFFVDRRDGVVRPYGVGQSLADYELIVITLDAVVCRFEGEERTIEVGRLLIGEAPPANPDAASAEPGAEPATESNDEELSVLEKLRRRREEELGQ
jgi:hypothetical protein